MAKKAAGKGAKAAKAAGAIPARFLKPLKETPLSAAFPAGGPLAIGAAAGAPAAVARLLQALGYTTVDEALNVLHAARREIVHAVGVPAAAVEALVQALAPLAAAIPDAVREAITSRAFGFGFALGQAHRSLEGPTSVNLLPALREEPAAPGVSPGGGGPIGFAPAVPAVAPPVGAALPSSVNLIDQLPHPVRDQGQRQTCVAHGSLVAYEHYLSARAGQADDLAEQFLYWACTQRDQLSHVPDHGTTMTAAAGALEQVGVCREAEWPYHPGEIPGNAGQGPPPGGATFSAAALRPENPVIRVTATAVEDFKRVLASGRCVAFAVPVYNSNFNPQASQYAATAFATGRITLPLPGEQPIGGHCMCMVGYEDDDSVPALGGGRFILRNSFGTAFGALSPYGAGHGTIPYAYIAARGQDTGIAFL